MIKFTGEIKNLKHMGFTFHKLYASNYKAYENEDVEMWIFVKGRDVHLNSLSEDQFEKAFDMIITDTYPLYESDRLFDGKVFFKKGDPRLCLYDKCTGEVLSHKDFMNKWKKEYPDLEDYMKFAYSGRFPEMILHKRHIDFIKKMYKKKLLIRT
jgi:hypothetical protein